MPETLHTEIACVVDRSGSMHRVADEAVEGFNEFLDDQRDVAGEARLTLTLFSNQVDVLYAAEPLERVDPLSTETFNPHGMTAMFDAVGATLETLRDRLDDLREEERPGRVLVLILTDGKENASSTWGEREVAEQVARCNDRDSWEFLFWGANIDALDVADRLNIDPTNAKQFAGDAESVTDAFTEMSQLTRDLRESDLPDDDPIWGDSDG